MSRVLFVDDEPAVLDALRRSLRRKSGEWEIAYLSSTAEAVAEQRRQPFDVVVADMHMPGMTGLDLIKELATVCDSTVAILLTGGADLEIAIAAINDAKVFRFYTKPWPAERLIAGITDALAMKNARVAAAPAPVSLEFRLGIATLNRLPNPVLVCERQGRVVFMNSRGAEQVGSGDGLSLSPEGVCRAGSETAELHRMIAAAVDGSHRAGPRALSVNRQSGRRPLSVVVSPLDIGPDCAPAAVLLVGDPDCRPLPPVQTVVRLFDLTDAEARLALIMAEGKRIEDAARHAGITLSSARTYLKRIFVKTGVTRQAELVRLILAAPTLLELSGE